MAREMLGLSRRRAEALLPRDSPHWLSDIGMPRAPDPTTLWRAFGVLVQERKAGRALDLLADLFAQEGLLDLLAQPLNIDSTCHERCHRSGRYDRVCRKLRLPDGGKYGRAARRAPARGPKKRHKLTRSKAVNRSRSRKARAMPELSLAVASACLLILAARDRTGNGSDAPDLDPAVLAHATVRAASRARASAGSRIAINPA